MKRPAITYMLKMMIIGVKSKAPILEGIYCFTKQYIGFNMSAKNLGLKWTQKSDNHERITSAITSISSILRNTRIVESKIISIF